MSFSVFKRLVDLLQIHKKKHSQELCLFLQDLQIWMQYNFQLAKPYGLANQKLCYIQTLLNIENFGEKKTKNVLKNGYWIWSQGLLG